MSKENYERSGWGRASDGSPIRLIKHVRKVAKWIKDRTKNDDTIYEGGTLPEVVITPDNIKTDEEQENPVKLTGNIKKIVKLIKSKGKPQL